MPHEDLNFTVRGHSAGSAFVDSLAREIDRWRDLATHTQAYLQPNIEQKRRRAALNDLAEYTRSLPLEDQRLAGLSKIHLALGRGWDTPYKAEGEQAAVLASFGVMSMAADSSRALDELVCAAVDDLQRAMNALRGRCRSRRRRYAGSSIASSGSSRS